MNVDPSVLHAISQAERVGDYVVARLLRKEAGLAPPQRVVREFCPSCLQLLTRCLCDRPDDEEI